MIRPLKPLSYQEERVCTYLYAGHTPGQVGEILGLRRNYVLQIINGAGRKIGGPPWASMSTRCLIWKAMEVGVLQYLAGLRGDDGRLLMPPPGSKPVIVQP